MSYRFSKKNVKKLYSEYFKIQCKFEYLLIKYNSRKFSNAEAAEYFYQGLFRRIQILARCIHNIFRICPPDQTARLEGGSLSDLDINLQSFVFNIFGCLDNLAWVWVKEKEIKNSYGTPLRISEIGFGEKYKTVRESFPKSFKNYIERKNFEEWFSYLNSYRHALAHRIPLYVPPYNLNEEELAQEQELRKAQIIALTNYNFEEYENIEKKLNSLGKFIPWMIHSDKEDHRPCIFHSQVISDWKTIVQISEKFFKLLWKE